jgi:hypothetical protein
MPPDKTAQRRPRRYVTAIQLRARYGGRSHVWLWRKLKRDPNFPKPFYMDGFRYWDEADLDQYDDAVRAAPPQLPTGPVAPKKRGAR